MGVKFTSDLAREATASDCRYKCAKRRDCPELEDRPGTKQNTLGLRTNTQLSGSCEILEVDAKKVAEPWRQLL